MNGAFKMGKQGLCHKVPVSSEHAAYSVHIGVSGAPAHRPRGKEPGPVETELLQLFGVLGQRGREE